MKQWPGIFMLSCALASATLIDAAFLSRNAVAASSEAAEIPVRQARPGLKLAENRGAATATEADAALEALIKQDEGEKSHGWKGG